ncbi:ankyrin repeat domain-containing protein [Kangiella shandongensis]|uniref:ankyrin repeat domain-containing protein n=1 Tax=Kangiella shandongensis TaxID=2763258 RepID=UPI001CC19F5B|nr:ankyrin repeat domain-containing protein [Kangiella shandongensis]
MNNDLEKIQLFIDNGYLERKFDNNSPLTIVIKYGTAGSFDLLLKNKKLNKKGSYEAVLYYLIKMEKEEMAEVIVEYVLEPNFALIKGSKVTLLHEAARHGMVDVCKQLISKGASTQKLTVGNYIPLTLAVKNKHMKASNYLVDVTEFKSISGISKEIILRNAVKNDRSLTILSKILANKGFSTNFKVYKVLRKISLEYNDEKLKNYIETRYKK